MIGLGVLDYHSNFRNVASQPSSYLLTTDKVISDIQHQEFQDGNTVSHLRIIHLTNMEGKGFAYVSFDVNGQSQYASMLVTQNGFDMGTASIKKDKAEPIQPMGSVGDGWEYITGMVSCGLSLKTNGRECPC